MNKKQERIIHLIPLCDNRCREFLISGLKIFLLVYPIHQFYYFKFEFTQWDLLLFSGVVTFIIGLRFVANIPDKFRDTISRLQKRQVLDFGAIRKEELFNLLKERGDHWARITGVLAALALGIGFVYSLSINFYWQRALLGVVETMGAYIAGNYLGRMASYGQLGWSLKKLNLSIKVDPFHVDGVGGLKPVGDYYFHQAMIVSIPAIFLAVWWFLFPVWPRDYGHWGDVYLSLMIGCLVMFILSFLVPLAAFHQIIRRQKENWQDVADTMSNELSDLRRAMEASSSDEDKNLLLTQIEEKKKHYWEIENMVTWPVDIKTKRKFRLNNILLLIPIIGDITKKSVNWQEVLDFVKSFST